MTVHSGQSLAITGRSGSGKTTLPSVIGMLAQALHRSGRSAEASLLLEAHRVALDSDLDCAVGPRSRNVEVALAAHSRSRILGTATSAEVAYRLQAAMRALEEIAQIVGAPALSRSLPIGQDLPAPASMGLR